MIKEVVITPMQYAVCACNTFTNLDFYITVVLAILAGTLGYLLRLQRSVCCIPHLKGSVISNIELAVGMLFLRTARVLISLGVQTSLILLEPAHCSTSACGKLCRICI